MRKKKIKFVGWFSYKDVDEIFTTLAEIPNLKNNPIFHEAPFDDAHKDAVIKELVENGYIICGDTHQAENHSCIPVFEDGYIFLSMRAWGALMAEAMNLKIGEEKYSYMDFYTASQTHAEEILPKGVGNEIFD